jgi:hypothetical protein
LALPEADPSQLKQPQQAAQELLEALLSALTQTSAEVIA